MSANVRLRQLSNLVRQKASLQAECACGHRGVLDAVRLRRWFFYHRWNKALEVVGLHLYCSTCRGRPVQLRPMPAKPDRPDWMQREQEWRARIP